MKTCKHGLAALAAKRAFQYTRAVNPAYSQGTRVLTQWRYTATQSASVSSECPLAARPRRDRMRGEHNMTYEACLRAHGRPLGAEFRSECERRSNPCLRTLPDTVHTSGEFGCRACGNGKG